MDHPALALLEFHSIAAGIEAGDAMVKRSPVPVVHAGTVHPGYYLVLVAGPVAEVEEAFQAGREVGGGALRDCLLLPHVHPAVITALTGERAAVAEDALGVVETDSVPAAIHAADAGIKGAEVTLLSIRLADGLGGKGLVLFNGLLTDVQAAVDLATERAHGHLVHHVIVPQLHDDMHLSIRRGRFGSHFVWEAW